MKYFRKSMFLLMIIVLLCISTTLKVYTNSGPVFWEGYPSSEILTIQKNSPIEVKQEKLIFDLRKQYNLSHHTISGQVTADYEMNNPTDQDLSVQMAFPFICSLEDFSRDRVGIMVNGKQVPYDVYIGDIVNNQGYRKEEEKDAPFDFEEIVTSISDQTYQAAHFSENELGILYTFEVKPTTEQRINFAVNFAFDSDQSKVLVQGFNGYEGTGEEVRITSWCYEPEVLQVFVFGKKIEFHVEGYTDGERKEKTDLFTYEVSTEEIQFKSYIMEQIHNEEKKKEERLELERDSILELDEEQIYNFYAASLDEIFDHNDGFGSFDDLMANNYSERILTLMYTVDFPAHSDPKISVHYDATGTMDMTETVDPVYSFDYILNPARNWSSFQDLTIEVYTPRDVPYIIDSSLDLTKENVGHYIGHFESLPLTDFSFSIYSNEEISVLDKVYGNLYSTFKYLTVLIIIGGVVFVGVVSILIIMMARYIRNKKDS